MSAISKLQAHVAAPKQINLLLNPEDAKELLRNLETVDALKARLEALERYHADEQAREKREFVKDFTRDLIASFADSGDVAEGFDSQDVVETIKAAEFVADELRNRGHL